MVNDIGTDIGLSGELSTDLIFLKDFLDEFFLERLQFACLIPGLEGIFEQVSLTIGFQHLAQFPQAFGLGVMGTFDHGVHPGLECADYLEIALIMAIGVISAQIVADVLHGSTEQLAINLLCKGQQVAAIVKEFPLLFLYITADEVALVVLNPLVHGSQTVFLSQREQEIVHRHANGIVLLELDIVIEITVQLAREVAQHGLEKRVYRADVEIAVVKQQLVERLPRQIPHAGLV